ncbi:hypothetical protein [Bacillus mycoides]|uniref:hypothetical protein n=1 Tax=Bacillus mycoides TaxID=1405 RepID=UPI002111060A|nr:hypothetical protein [Bacillus mycoides]MCQ6531129.1 hypothetical protein [Bacillus mycoides]
MKQLTIDDIVGSFDYKATSTSERFLKGNMGVMTPTYEIHFYNKDEKQMIDWFEAFSEADTKSDAIAKHGSIQIIKIVLSARTLAEIMDLD